MKNQISRDTVPYDATELRKFTPTEIDAEYLPMKAGCYDVTEIRRKSFDDTIDRIVLEVVCAFILVLIVAYIGLHQVSFVHAEEKGFRPIPTPQPTLTVQQKKLQGEYLQQRIVNAGEDKKSITELNQQLERWKEGN